MGSLINGCTTKPDPDGDDKKEWCKLTEIDKSTGKTWDVC